MIRSRTSLRSGSNPALVAAVALALLSLAVAGSQAAHTAGRVVEARPALAEADAARIMAAAVEAARNLLTVKPALQAVMPSQGLIAPPADMRALPCHIDERCWLPAAVRLGPRLIDLPPPVC